MKARRERAEALEAEPVANVCHARAGRERALRLIDAQLHEILMGRDAERRGELTREVRARKPGDTREVIERRPRRELGVQVIAGSNEPLQDRTARHAAFNHGRRAKSLIT